MEAVYTASRAVKDREEEMASTGDTAVAPRPTVYIFSSVRNINHAEDMYRVRGEAEYPEILIHKSDRAACYNDGEAHKYS